jgi:transposase-like protein
MPSRYDDSQKQAAIDQLRANRGDVARTATETGVNERTLFQWRREAGIGAPTKTPPLQPSRLRETAKERGAGGEVPPPPSPPQNVVPLADAALVTELRTLLTQMLQAADQLVKSINEAIAPAPLNQRVVSLAQLTDRIIKLATELPQPPEEIDYEGYLPSLEQPTPQEAGSAAAASQPTADSAE